LPVCSFKNLPLVDILIIKGMPADFEMTEVKSEMSSTFGEVRSETGSTIGENRKRNSN